MTREKAGEIFAALLGRPRRVWKWAPRERFGLCVSAEPLVPEVVARRAFALVCPRERFGLCSESALAVGWCSLALRAAWPVLCGTRPHGCVDHAARCWRCVARGRVGRHSQITLVPILMRIRGL